MSRAVWTGDASDVMAAPLVRVSAVAAVSDALAIYYLATPYSKRAVVSGSDARFCPFGGAAAASEAAQWAAVLAQAGVTAISPIVQAHAMCDEGGHDLDPLDAAFWERWCRPLLWQSRGGVLVPPIDGYRESAGIAAEVAFAREWGIPVYRLERVA